jgi:predicted transcriptional regulator
MDVIYARGQATAQQVRDALPDPPSYSAVRALLRVLEDKGHVTHREDGPRYVYRPTVPREKASASALRSVVRTFFDGSAADAAAALLGLPHAKLSTDEINRLQELIDRARKEGRT